MITIIFAPPGFGKTALMSHLLNEACFDYDRYRNMRLELKDKKTMGFDIPIPANVVSANYSLTMKKVGFSHRQSRRINPFRLGFNNPNVETHFNFPYEVIGIDEAQIYLNSRMSVYYPAWQSRWYEAHRHNDLEIYLATQRPGLIDVNIRELSEFLEVIDMNVTKDGYGNACKIVWTVRYFPFMRLYDKYVASGGLDKNTYESRKIVADYNVFDIYDSQSCKPKFYDGYLKHIENSVKFDSGLVNYDYSLLSDESVASYLQYLETFPDEYPEGFYKIGKSKKEHR